MLANGRWDLIRRLKGQCFYPVFKHNGMANCKFKHDTNIYTPPPLFSTAPELNIFYISVSMFFFLARHPPLGHGPLFTRFLDHTQQRTTVGRTLLDEWPAPRRDLYLTTHNIHNRRTSMPPVGFNPTIPAGNLRQTYALDRAATGIGLYVFRSINSQ